MSDKAKRFNQGKIDHTLHYIPALEEMAKVWMYGEGKYGRSNWHKLWGDETINVVMASLLRHAFAIQKGELFDQETGLTHASHLMCNCCMIIKHMNDNNIINKEIENENNSQDDNIKSLFSAAFDSSFSKL